MGEYLELFMCLVHLPPEESVGTPVTGITHICEPPCACWESNLGPVEEQPVLLTAEPSLQPLPSLLSLGFAALARLADG